MTLEKTITIDTLIENLAAAGFAPDAQQPHRRIVELRRCRCKKSPLVYHGYSDAETYLALGACPACRTVTVFAHLSDINRSIIELFAAQTERSEAAS